MKSYFFLPLIGILITSTAFCQSITIYNGGAFSHLRKNGIEVLNNNISTYSGYISFEYLNRKNFYLSSQIGYNQLGGKENNPLLDGVPLP